MAKQSTAVILYTCDTCGKEEEMESFAGMTPPWPAGWLGINGVASASEDLFCSWDCLGQYATNKGVEVKAAKVKREQDRKKIKEKAKKDGGLI